MSNTVFADEIRDLRRQIADLRGIEQPAMSGGLPVYPALTQSRVLFAGVGGVLAESSSFTWNDTTKQLGFIATSDTDFPQTLMYRARSGPGATLANDTLAAFSSAGHTGIGYTGISGRMRLVADENFSGTALGTSAMFDLVPNGTTSRATVFKLTGDGNLGLGAIPFK